jgi:hypothetical protein
MIPKRGYRFSDEIMRQPKRMIPKSGHRFSDKIMRQPKRMIPKSGHRFSDKIMRQPWILASCSPFARSRSERRVPFVDDGGIGLGGVMANCSVHQPGGVEALQRPHGGAAHQR